MATGRCFGPPTGGPPGLKCRTPENVYGEAVVSGNNEFGTFRTLAHSDTGVPTQVDIKSLEGAAPWLDSLKQYVQDHLITATGAMNLTTNYGDLYFGGVDSAK